MSSWVECQLCPKYCRIESGRAGDCRIRMNLDGKLIASTHGRPCAMHLDPIEKKPLFHFLPGTTIFSVATAGCNLHCTFCQNYSISQSNPEETEAYLVAPEDLVKLAVEQHSPSLAYTYTEPLAYYEYTLDGCAKAREAGLRNVLVTAGYGNEKPLSRLLPLVDAANVDLKGFTNEFYVEHCGATLRPVLRCLELCVKLGVWLEITNLVIPTLNDDMARIASMCGWIRENLGAGTPLHFSRFWPRWKMKNLPPTPAETLEAARDTALEAGLKYVYVGNMRSREGENTFCPNPDCPDRGRPLIARVGYEILGNRLANGRCPACATAIEGVWK
jgi:pyruvate formate lyase activating enzyme